MLRRGIWLTIPAVLVFGIGCGLMARASAEGQERKPIRAMTYNIQWFAENENPQRIANLKSVMTNIKPDIVALQEIQSRRALAQIFDSNWEFVIKDDPAQQQELAIAVRRPFKIESWELIFDSKTLDEGFPGNRDVLKAVVRTPDNDLVTVYSVHLKSRRGGRKSTDFQRQMQAGMLASYIAAKNERNAIVLGDFNDAPNDAAPNILETGDLLAKGGPTTPRLMVNLTDPLNDKDYVTIGLSRLFQGQDLNPIVPGARADNDRLRGQDYEFPRDVRVQQSFFDNILVSMGLRATSGQAVVYARADSIRGRGGRVTVNDQTGAVTYEQKGDRASDHQPVYFDFTITASN